MGKILYKNEEIQYSIIRKNIKNIYIRIKNGAVIVTAPKYITKEEIEKLLIKKANWIYKKLKVQNLKNERPDLYTKEEFIEIVEKTAKELICKTGIKPNKIRIREIKYAWGSCSSNKNITINLKLMAYSKEAIRYVILHELCHIKYMNHSKSFWKLVESYMPDYKEVKKEFRVVNIDGDV